MVCPQCKAKTATGEQCKLTTCKQYPYCWIHLKKIDGLQVKKSEIAGEGLFYVGKKDFQPNKIIAYYSAKEVTRKPINGEYVLEVGKNKYLDGKDKSNYVGRYVNSTRGTGKQPNVRFASNGVITKRNGRDTVPIITKKKIKPNTELLMNYGKDYKLPKKKKK